MAFLYLRGRMQWVWVTVALGAVIAWLPDVQAANLPESTSKLVFARQIDREYTASLGLKGRSASYAFTTLLGEGFRCDLHLVSPVIGLDLPPFTQCRKLSSGFGPLCDDLEIMVHFERQPEIKSREELFERLDTVLVDFPLAFCPYPDEVSVEFVGARAAAEQELSQQVNALELIGNAQSAYKKLLMQDYYCGFLAATAEDGATPAEPARMVCTRRWTRIRYCHEAKLVMDVDWPSGVTSMTQFYAALPNAQIKAVRSSCEIPNIRPDGQKL